MKKKLLSLGLVAALAVSATACGSSSSGDSAPAETTAASGNADSSDGAAEGGTIKIGGIGPITGEAAIYGQAVMNGAQLAVDEINAAGGINGMTIEYRFEDDESDSEKAVNAYNTLKDWDMQVLMGTVTSTPCIAVAAKSFEDNIFQLTPSGSSVPCIEHPNAFRVCFSDPNQGAASAEYIGTHELATKVAVIYDSSSVYSSGIYEKFAAGAAEQGIEIVSAEAFTADSNKDFSVQLQTAKANNMGYEPMFFGCDGLDGLLTVPNFDLALAEDVMLLTPFAADAEDELTQSFVSRYEEQFGGIPNQFAADAYDAIYAIKAAAEDAGITSDMTPSDICDKLVVSMTNITIDGLTGEGMTWTADGEPNKAPKAVKIVDGVYTAM